MGYAKTNVSVISVLTTCLLLIICSTGANTKCQDILNNPFTQALVMTTRSPRIPDCRCHKYWVATRLKNSTIQSPCLKLTATVNIGARSTAVGRLLMRTTLNAWKRRRNGQCRRVGNREQKLWYVLVCLSCSWHPLNVISRLLHVYDLWLPTDVVWRSWNNMAVCLCLQRGLTRHSLWTWWQEIEQVLG